MADTSSRRVRSAPVAAQLRDTITNIDCIAQDRLDTFADQLVLVRIALAAQPGEAEMRVVRLTIDRLHDAALDLRNDINATAEEVGCNFEE